MPKDQKRLFRETKKLVKKDGNRSRRRHLKRQLEDDPQNAHLDVEYEFKYNSSTYFNGRDKDSTRRDKPEGFCSCCGRPRVDGVCHHSKECIVEPDDVQDFIEEIKND